MNAYRKKNEKRSCEMFMIVYDKSLRIKNNVLLTISNQERLDILYSLWQYCKEHLEIFETFCNDIRKVWKQYNKEKCLKIEINFFYKTSTPVITLAGSPVNNTWNVEWWTDGCEAVSILPLHAKTVQGRGVRCYLWKQPSVLRMAVLLS